jgi:hypothetical protein
MAGHPISEELQQFIARYIHSVEQVEILCLLVENPDKTWRESEVFKRIQSSADSVRRNLEYFATGLFLSGNQQNGYGFAPINAELKHLAIELVKTYREKRVTVVESIYRGPTDPIRDFADAFRIRKDKP